MTGVERRAEPPGKPTSYVIPCYGGEIWTIPTSNSVLRLLVTGKETDGAFAVVGSGGTFDKPIGFHYHREAHDIFLCLKGTMNVWANDQARSLHPGDFASVPPGTIHQYQLTSNHTENIGLIIPGGWEEFFRFIGEPFSSGPLFPTHDTRNPFEVLVPRLIAATEKFDMVPVRDKLHFDPQPWNGTENILPGECVNGGYFLKADTGPKYEVAGLVVRPLATGRETGGRFSIYSVEGGKMYGGRGKGKEKFRWEKVHHAVHLVEGQVKFVLDGEEVVVQTGETTFVPAGTTFSFEAASNYFKGYFFANGGGIGEALTRVGREYEWSVVPVEADVGRVDEGTLQALGDELGFTLV